MQFKIDSKAEPMPNFSVVLQRHLLHNFFNKSLDMLAFYLSVGPAVPSCLWDGSTVCATRSLSQARRAVGFRNYSDCTEALKLVNFFEDRQGTPERTEMTPVYISLKSKVVLPGGSSFWHFHCGNFFEAFISS